MKLENKDCINYKKELKKLEKIATLMLPSMKDRTKDNVLSQFESIDIKLKAKWLMVNY